MHNGKVARFILMLVLVVTLVIPTAVFAGSDGPSNHHAPGKVLLQQGDEAEEGSAQEGSSDGVGFVMGLLAGLIFLIVAVVAVLGAVGLGVIGIGYASVSSGDE